MASMRACRSQVVRSSVSGRSLTIVITVKKTDGSLLFSGLAAREAPTSSIIWGKSILHLVNCWESIGFFCKQGMS